ncbi:predicted protein [Postia placenta Mad-698-R]|nr:predicted protein [Postia placenta Mad-698-R]
MAILVRFAMRLCPSKLAGAGIAIVGVVRHNTNMAVAIPAAEGRGVAYYGDFQTNEKVSIQAQGTLQSMAGLTTGIYITRQRTGVETYGFQHDCRAHARFISDSTENLIRTLVVYSINRGIFTAVFQLAQFCNRRLNMRRKMRRRIKVSQNETTSLPQVGRFVREGNPRGWRAGSP